VAVNRALVPVLLLASLSRAGTVFLNILHTNDMHGGIVDVDATFMNPDFPPGIGGGAWIASFVREARESCEQAGEFFLLVDVGDCWQGTPVGNYDSGAFVVEWMNSVGFDMTTLGNHDFDRGAETALRNAGLMDFPVLCCNFETEDGIVPDEIIPYIIMDFGGVKTAFIGLATPDTRTLVDQAGLEGYRFTGEVEAVERCAAEAREQGADVIVLVSHLGQPPDPETYLERVFEAWDHGVEYTKGFALNNAELTCVVSGLDAVISGHTHVGLAEPWVNPVTHAIVVQGYANGTGIGWIRLHMDTETGTVTGFDCPLGDEYVSLLHDQYWPDPENLALVESFRSVAEAGMDEVVGLTVSEIPRGAGEHPLGRLVADAIRWRTGADVALMNRGGIRAAIPRGRVTARTVYSALPFEEDLMAFRVTGARLLEILETGMQGRRRDMEISGFTCRRNQSMPDGSKIEDPMVGGIPLDPEAEYVFATTGYLAYGSVGYGILTSLEPWYTGYGLMDTVIEYIRAHSPIEPDYRDRVVWVD
jgi:2',3'-cyclic-nucleotide 2'-phosphodiesterase (5'-nucleotidase family)